MEISRKNFNTVLKKAQKLQIEGNFEAALTLYKQLAGVNELPWFHQRMGEIYLVLGRVEEALKSFRTMALLEPENKEIHFFIGNCFCILKRYGEAIKAYEKSLELDPDNPYTHDNMANAWEELKLYNESLRLRKKAASLKPDDAFIQCNMGNTLYKLGLKDEAMEVYKNSACLDPKYPDVYYYMGNCLCSMENYKQAIQAYSMALDLNPNFIDVLNNMGNAYFDIGKLDEALSHYQKARELDPQNPEVLNNLGDLYSILGEYESAMQCYNEIVEHYADELVENLIKNKKDRCPVHPAGYVKQRQIHYKKYLGEFSRVLHTIAEDKKPFIDIYEIPPQKGRYFWTYITAGMSDVPQNVPVDSNGKTNPYTELIIYTSEKSVWARKVLYNLAYHPFLNNTYVNYASAIEFDFPFVEESEMKNALLLDTKVEEKGFHDFELNSRKVNFLRVVPLSDAELRHKNMNGLSSLLGKLSEAQIDFITDITRKSIIK